MRSFVVWGSVVVSGRGSPVASVVVHRCFGKVPSAGVSETVLFGGDGIAGRVWQLVGDVAIGASAIAWGGKVSAGDVDVVGGGGMSGWDADADADVVVVPAPAAAAVSSVCVAVASSCRLSGLNVIGGCVMDGPAAANLLRLFLLMTSISCWLYFSGRGCLLMVLARITLLLMPMRCSLVAVPLPI